MCYIPLLPSPGILKNWSRDQQYQHHLGNLLDGQILGTQPRHSESETLGVEDSYLSLKELSGWLWYISLRWSFTANHLAKQIRAKPVCTDVGGILEAWNLRSQKTVLGSLLVLWRKGRRKKKITNFLVNFPNGFSNLYHMQSIMFSKIKHHSWDLKKRGIEDHTWEKKFLSFLLWKKYNTY